MKQITKNELAGWITAVVIVIPILVSVVMYYFSK